MKTERSGGIYDKEYLSVPVVYRPQGASWTFQLALFLSHILYARPPLKCVKSACRNGNRWLLPTSSATGFWSLGCLCISGWEDVQAANCSQMTLIPSDWCLDFFFFHTEAFQTALQSKQKRQLKCKKQTKKNPSPTKLSQTFHFYNPAERTHHFLSFPLNAPRVPHAPLPDFIGNYVPQPYLLEPLSHRVVIQM